MRGLAFKTKRLLIQKLEPGKPLGPQIYVEKTVKQQVIEFLLSMFIYGVVFATGYIAGLMQ